jgi:hypothetical protein
VESLINVAGEQPFILKVVPLAIQDTTNLLFADGGIDTNTVTPSLLQQAEEMAKHVGYLPLAVVQTASFMKDSGTNLENMLKLYKDDHKIDVRTSFSILIIRKSKA